MKLEYKIKLNDDYQTINDVLKKEFILSTRLFSKVLKNQLVFKNNVFVDTRNLVETGDVIIVSFDDEENSDVSPTEMKLSIIYEDEAYLVVNKPSGIPIHPSSTHYNDSLSNGISYYFKQLGLKKKIRPVNRLDLFTSGIVIFAKNEYVQEYLIRQMLEKQFQKEYLCFVEGKLTSQKGILTMPIARKEGSIIERCISTDGKLAITHYEVLQEYTGMTFLKCTLETGRTHQIRVHFSSIGHPILGDTLYGKKSSKIVRQALHSSMVSFKHPMTKKIVTYVSDVPSDMKNLHTIQ